MKDKLADIRRDYGDRHISPETLLDDPIDQFRLWFSEAQDAQIYEPNAMALSSVAVNGQPATRMVLLKEINDEGFVFFTDYESRKGRDIEANNHVSLLFWWDRIHRQVRVEGIASKVGPEVSNHYFNSRPLGSRFSAAASLQSEVVLSRDVLEQKVEELEHQFGATGPPRPKRWGGYCVTPTAVEFWQGRSNRLHDRIRYQREGDRETWSKFLLSP